MSSLFRTDLFLNVDIFFLFSLDSWHTMSGSKKAVILGTGNLGQALAYRLVSSGYQVSMGSRDPSKSNPATLNDLVMKEVYVGSIKSCLLIQDVSVIFLAIHYHNVVSALSPFRSLLNGKILVDTSNRTELSQTGSNAEELASHFPEARIVKGFNTLSAYTLQKDSITESVQRVYLAADDISARETVASIVRDMGYCPVYCGGLQAARRIEASPLELLSGWGRPTVILSGVFLVWFGIMVIKYSVKYASADKDSFPWKRVPLTLLNLLVCLTAITLLAITYLPGCLAAFVQLYNRTKYKLFPSWLDLWLKGRKMLGLYALLFSVWHAVMSAIFISPGSMAWWYETKTHWESNHTIVRYTYRLNGIGESALSFGIMSLLLMTLIGISSLPSVGSVLNWREWQFVQSQMGYTALLLAVAHVFAMSFRGWFTHPTSFFYWNSFLCCIIPSLVLAMKLFLTFPCVSRLVSQIRNGQERRPIAKQSKERTSVEIQLLENDTV